jgi:hypothetical protein
VISLVRRYDHPLLVACILKVSSLVIIRVSAPPCRNHNYFLCTGWLWACIGLSESEWEGLKFVAGALK